jgi:hypothetical protein
MRLWSTERCTYSETIAFINFSIILIKSTSKHELGGESVEPLPGLNCRPIELLDLILSHYFILNVGVILHKLFYVAPVSLGLDQHCRTIIRKERGTQDLSLMTLFESVLN